MVQIGAIGTVAMKCAEYIKVILLLDLDICAGSHARTSVVSGFDVGDWLGRYEGMWWHGLKHGEGKFIDADGNTISVVSAVSASVATLTVSRRVLCLAGCLCLCCCLRLLVVCVCVVARVRLWISALSLQKPNCTCQCFHCNSSLQLPAPGLVSSR